MAPPWRINLGGEGEVPGVLNQQGRWAILDPLWQSSRGGQTFRNLVATGHEFLIADNVRLPIPDESYDEVITNNVPIDWVTHWGPSVQTSEVLRILKPGGIWTHDNNVRLVKP